MRRWLARIVVSVDTTRYRIQGLRSLAMHEEAVRRVRAEPELISRPRQFFKSGWMLGTSARPACGLCGKTSWSIASGVRHGGEPTERRN